MMDENELWVNADIAERYGLNHGNYIKLKNQDGIISNKIKVKATERIRQDCVYMTHGFGHNAKMMKQALLKGASDSQMITKYAIDPLMGGTGMNVNFVTIVTN
jgi:thiosulfate reductase/polysulfide reductase chain A